MLHSSSQRLGARRTCRAVAWVILAAATFEAAAQNTVTLTPGPNVNVSLTTENQYESTLAINPGNPQNVVCLCNSSGSTYGVFEAISTDGGASWPTAGVVSAALAFPSVSWDSIGNLFLSAADSTGTNIVVYVSTDGGNTFTLLQTFTDAAGVAGISRVAAGPDPTATGSVWIEYFSFTTNNIMVSSASVTGLGVVGAFSPAQSLPNSAGNFATDMIVGPKGEVIIAQVAPAAILVSVDADGLGPNGFANPVTVVSNGVAQGALIPAQNTYGIIALPMLAWDRGNSTFTGRVYISYTDFGAGGDTDIFLVSSDDTGTTWSAPVLVNDDGGANDQFMASVAVDQSTGNVAVAFYDCRNDSGNNGQGDTDGVPDDDAEYFLAVSPDGGATFAPNVQLSVGASNAADSDVNSGGFDFGDYQGIGFSNGNVVTLWSDNSNSTGDNVDGTLTFLELYSAATTVVTKPVITPGTGQPDLIVSAIKLLGTPVAGFPFTIDATITNQGPNDAGPFYVSAFSDPQYVGLYDQTVTDFSVADPSHPKKVSVAQVQGLPQGTSVDVILTMLYNTPGVNTVAVLADSQQNVDEADELNNELTQRVLVVGASKDIVAVSMVTTNIVPGKTATFSAILQNRGTLPTGPFSVGFFANRALPPTTADTPDSTQAVANLGSFGGANDTTTLTFTLPAQNVARGGRAWIYADIYNAVAEDVETNNVASAIWGIPNTAPAILSSITANPPLGTATVASTFTVVAGDPDGDPLFYSWDFGDGSGATPGGASIAHAFAAPGSFNVAVTVSDGPFTNVQSSLTYQVLDSTLVDLGFVIEKSGKVKLRVPLPPGLTTRDRAKATIIQGTPGNHVKLRNQILAGTPDGPGVYTFTVEYLAPKTKKLIQVRYMYTVLN